MRKTLSFIMILMIATTFAACASTSDMEELQSQVKTLTSENAKLKSENKTLKEAQQKQEEEKKKEEAEKKAAEEAKAKEQVLLDNNVVKITITDTYEDDYGIGWKTTVENKTDKIIEVGTTSVSINGKMKESNFFTGNIDAGMSTDSDLTFDKQNSGINSMTQLKKVKGQFYVSIANSDDNGIPNFDEQKNYDFMIKG